MQVTVEEIKKARATLDGVISRTGLSYSNILSEMSGNEVYLKMENLQRTGSFKVRGAYNKVANLSEHDKQSGVIASSAGNHAQGVALAATTFGIKSTIVMPKHAPLSKVIATQGYGAKVVLHGDVYDDAYAEARRIQKEENATFVHPFDDPLVIAGQGTIALEMLEDLPDVDVVVVPIGGGGLISGMAVALKELKPSIKVIGVQTKNMPSMAEALAQKRIVTVDGIPTIADGIAVKTPGALTFEICQHYVDEIVTVDEEEIARAILLLLERVKTVAEGAGAVSIAAVLNCFPALKHRKLAAVISGGNIDVNTVTRIINKGLVKSGRKVFFDTVISDKPGELWQLLKLIADSNANVLAVTHSRESRDVALGSCRVELELETANEEQIAKIRKLMEERHYSVDMR
ncbi:L-threonine dehydratase catabolic TdcB [Peptococcaceae bacterium CEB3]|nr:L-threonine dehydratase catabolic TdcB [Peptococcaceae bacterium CEB3]